MAKTKVVKFYYFKLVRITTQGFDSIDLSQLFSDIHSSYSLEENRFVYEYKGEKAKLAYINPPYDNESYYQLTFERLRDFNYPVKTKLKGDSTELDLSPDEFLGEEVSVLYDHRNNIMMIQNNRDSLSYKAIELFLNALLLESVKDNEEGEEVEVTNQDGSVKLSLITERDPFGRVRSFVGLREVILKTNILATQVSEGHIADLYDAIKGETGDYDADNLDVEVKITVKNRPSTNKYLSSEIVEEVLSYNNDEGVKKIRVKGVDIDNKVDEVNLIENKISDKFSFNFEENRQLNKDVVYTEMENIYRETGQNKVLRNI